MKEFTPESQYIKIPLVFLMENDTKGTKFIDILVYAIIDMYRCKDISNIGMRTMAQKYNIPLSKIEDAVKRLKDKGYITYAQHPSQKYDKYMYNEYHFPLHKKWKNVTLNLSPKILELPLKPKERGMLIYFQMISCDTGEMAQTKMEEIAKELKITRQTVSKYINRFIADGYLEKLERGKYFFYKISFLVKQKKTEDKEPYEFTL